MAQKRKAGSFHKWYDNNILFSLKERQKLYTHFAQEMASGNTIRDAQTNYLVLVRAAGKTSLYKLLNKVFRSNKDGMPLGTCFADLIPYDEQSVLNAGVESADYVSAFENLKDIAARKNETGLVPFLLLLYPLLSIVIALRTWRDYGDQLAPLQYGLLQGGEFSGKLGVLIVFAENASWLIPSMTIIPLIILTIFIRSLPNWTGKARTKADQYFPYSLYRKYQSASFLVTLGAMRKGGIAEASALRKISSQATPYLRVRLNEILKKMEGKGLSFGEAAREAAYDVPDIEQSIIIASMKNSSQYGSQLLALAQDTQKATLARMKIILSVIFFSLMIVGLLGQVFVMQASMEIQQQVDENRNRF